MQPVCLCILWDILFKNTFENPQRRKIKQMQPVRLCMLCTLSLCSKTMGSPFRVKALLHVLHLKGFSPVWVLMWWCKFPEEAQVKLLWLHLNGHFCKFSLYSDIIGPLPSFFSLFHIFLRFSLVLVYSNIIWPVLLFFHPFHLHLKIYL